MRQRTVFALLIGMGLLLVLGVFSVENQPHDFKKCAFCHGTDTPAGAEAIRLIAPMTLLCTGCHSTLFSEGYMHPVDVRPRRAAIPADMPLSPSGNLTCGTCHDVHADYYTPYGTPTRFLRRQEERQAFCMICHKQELAGGKGHPAALQEAHFRSRYVITDPLLELDPMSMNCISCHDGTFASSVTIQTGLWIHEKGALPHDRGSHPIGIHYEAARLRRGRKTDLRPISQIDRRIRFFDGKVGCGSCHDPYSTREKQLVVSDENSKLCYSCHMV